jgi:hypothetical protein
MHRKYFVREHLSNAALKIIRFFILYFVCVYLSRSAVVYSVYSGRDFSEGTMLYVPTGVSASDGDYADKVGIMWNTVRRASLYRIFRSTEVTRHQPSSRNDSRKLFFRYDCCSQSKTIFIVCALKTAVRTVV